MNDETILSDKEIADIEAEILGGEEVDFSEIETEELVSIKSNDEVKRSAKLTLTNIETMVEGFETIKGFLDYYLVDYINLIKEVESEIGRGEREIILLTGEKKLAQKELDIMIKFILANKEGREILIKENEVLIGSFIKDGEDEDTLGEKIEAKEESRFTIVSELEDVISRKANLKRSYKDIINIVDVVELSKYGNENINIQEVLIKKGKLYGVDSIIVEKIVEHYEMLDNTETITTVAKFVINKQGVKSYTKVISFIVEFIDGENWYKDEVIDNYLSKVESSLYIKVGENNLEPYADKISKLLSKENNTKSKEVSDSLNLNYGELEDQVDYDRFKTASESVILEAIGKEDLFRVLYNEDKEKLGSVIKDINLNKNMSTETLEMLGAMVERLGEDNEEILVIINKEEEVNKKEVKKIGQQGSLF